MSKFDQMIIDQARKHCEEKNPWYDNTNYIALVMVCGFLVVISMIVS